jgi:hypothetical protein
MSSLPSSDPEKVDGAQVENVLSKSSIGGNAQAAGGFCSRILKKNPSPKFLEDLSKMNNAELDPREVKRIERKVDYLVMPALSVCYMVCLYAIEKAMKFTKMPSSTTCECYHTYPLLDSRLKLFQG